MGREGERERGSEGIREGGWGLGRREEEREEVREERSRERGKQ